MLLRNLRGPALWGSGTAPATASSTVRSEKLSKRWRPRPAHRQDAHAYNHILVVAKRPRSRGWDGCSQFRSTFAATGSPRSAPPFGEACGPVSRCKKALVSSCQTDSGLTSFAEFICLPPNFCVALQRSCTTRNEFLHDITSSQRGQRTYYVFGEGISTQF